MKHTVPQDSSNAFSYANNNSSRSNSIAFSTYGSVPGDFTPTHHPSSTFSSPTVEEIENTYGSNPFSNMTYGNAGIGLGLQWNGSYAPQSEVLSSRIDNHNAAMASNQQFGFPPTPRSSDSESARQMGSARSSSTGFDVSPTTLKSNVDAIPTTKKSKARRPKNNKTTTTKTPQIDAPLSQLTKDMDVPLRDMEAWVNRPTEERQKEVDKRKGYVTRPMNSFMLYRSAYAERTKTWCLQNNHQVVSAVSGESWPLEPPAIREKYNELARVERENHAKAHPTYKFSPSKLGTNGTRRRKDTEGADVDEDDIRSSDDGEWKPSRGPNKRRKSVAGLAEQSAYYSPPHSPLSGDNASYGNYNNTITRPASKALPNSFGTGSSFFDYTFQPAQELSPAMMHDMRVRNVPSPALAAQQQQILAAQQQQHAPAYTLHPLASLPGSGSKYPTHNDHTIQNFTTQLDPSLPIFSDGFTHGNNPLVVMNDGAATNYNPEVFSFEESSHPAFTDSFFTGNHHTGHYEDMLNQQQL